MTKALRGLASVMEKAQTIVPAVSLNYGYGSGWDGVGDLSLGPETGFLGLDGGNPGCVGEETRFPFRAIAYPLVTLIV